MGITIGQLCDSLSIINIKIFMLEDVKRDEKATDSEIASATKSTNKLNSQRSEIIDELDQAMNKIAEGQKQKLFGTNKMYGK